METKPQWLIRRLEERRTAGELQHEFHPPLSGDQMRRFRRMRAWDWDRRTESQRVHGDPNPGTRRAPHTVPAHLLFQ